MVQRIPYIPGILAALALLVAGCEPSAETPATPTPPASAETPSGPGSTTSTDGVKIAYTVHGQGEPALVFIHGWSCDQSFWSEQISTFAADHAVVTVDLAGHGQSGTERTDWTLSSFGDDVKAVVDALGFDQVILVGHSMGGPAALEAARLMTDRVVGVIGVDTFHDADQKTDPEQWEGVLSPYETDYVGTCEKFVRSMYLEDAAAALVERTVSEMCDGPPDIGLALLREFGKYELAGAMTHVSAPIRTINATLYPTNVENNRKYAPEFEAELMEGVGHFLMMERPEEFNALLSKVVADLKSRLVVMQ